MRDIRNIIKPLGIAYSDNIEKNMDSILENLIIRDMMTCDSFLFNHFIYNNKDEAIIRHLIDISIKYIQTNVKNQRVIFRELNKKNKLDLSHYITYFDNFYKMLTKLAAMLQHVICNNPNATKRWGDNVIINHSIYCIVNTLCYDITFKLAIFRTVHNMILKPDDVRTDMYRMMLFIRNFSTYISTDETLYMCFVKHIDSALVDTVPTVNMNIDANMIDVYNFSKLYSHYIKYHYKFSYITKTHEFINLKKQIEMLLINIISKNNITFVKNFIVTYKSQLNVLIKHIDMTIVLLSCKPTDVNMFIDYYSTLCEISNNNTVLYEIIINCAKQEINTYFNSSDKIEFLAKLINTNIINNHNNKFHYTIGSILSNKDEFIAFLCQKFMERIIYMNIEVEIETNNHNMLTKIFTPVLMYKYNIILEDYNNSVMFNTMYKSVLPPNTNLIISSLDVWKINHTAGYSVQNKCDGILSDRINLVHKCYQVNNMNKTLLFYLHLGYADITIGNTNMIVLPAHMICLELFNSMDTVVPYQSMYEHMKQVMTNYNDAFITKIISSLVAGGVIKQTNNMYSLRKELIENNSQNTVICIIDIFHQIDNTSKFILRDISAELCHSRMDIISTNIMHNLKQNEYDVNTLYGVISTDIKLFNVTNELYQKTLLALTEREYISIILNIIKKIDF